MACGGGEETSSPTPGGTLPACHHACLGWEDTSNAYCVATGQEYQFLYTEKLFRNMLPAVEMDGLEGMEEGHLRLHTSCAGTSTAATICLTLPSCSLP